MPLLALVMIKISHLAMFSADGNKIMLIVFLAIITPSASTITQMCQVYGNDSRYASAINVMTTLFSIITMPLMVMLFEAVIIKQLPVHEKRKEITMNITVYLGALEGNDPALGDAVRELGTWIGESGNSLVYGGSKSGLMGQIAESVLNAGGKVTGVEPLVFYRF